MIKDLLAKLRADRPRLAPLIMWRAYVRLDDYKGADPSGELTALVALVRRASDIDGTLTRHGDRARANFQCWVMQAHAGTHTKFSPEQMAWLQVIRHHLATSFRIERDDLEFAPFDGQGGLRRMHALFGDRMDAVMAELNERVAVLASYQWGGWPACPLKSGPP
ncbi:MAG: type I restriction-modification enzyme R subunit C-terminal domain-containing protein [Pseudomonadota bacterium]